MNNVLKTIYVEDVESLVTKILNKLHSFEDDYSICIVGKFEEIEKAVRYSLEFDDINIERISISDPEFSGYNNEYYLHFILTDSEIGLYCEVSRDEERIINNSCEETYILSNCGSKIINYCETSEKYLAIIGEDECFDYDITDDYECYCNNDNIYGFTVDNETDNGYSKFTYYSSSPVDKSDIRDILRKFGF